MRLARDLVLDMGESDSDGDQPPSLYLSSGKRAAGGSAGGSGSGVVEERLVMETALDDKT